MSSERARPHDAAQATPAPPDELLLEMARARDAGDPFAFQFTEQDYLLRREGGVYESAAFPWDEALLDDLAALQPPRADPAARQRMGERLRGFLDRAGWSRLEERIEVARDPDRRVHITIRASAAELNALPWELVTLRSTGQHLGELPGCLVRYEWPGTRTATPVPDPPSADGRVLFAWSAAGGPVPAAEHHAALRRACAAGQVPFSSQDVLAHLSLQGLYQALEAPGAPVTVLHILCHGGALDAGGGYGLVWNRADTAGSVDMIDAGALRQALGRHAGTLRMVVLCACHGGDPGPLGSHLGSVAQALHRVGLPAVVASRAPLSSAGSVILTEAVYQRLLVDLGSLEDAVVHARQQLVRARTGLDWAVLQLYQRRDDGPDLRPVVFRPYRGLAAYTAAQRRFYFGREAETAALVEALRDGQRLTFLVGASGSGKSSLVMAGLVPEVEAGALGAAQIAVRVLRPGPRPCRALAQAVLENSPDRVSDIDALASALGERPEALSEHLAATLPPGTRVLLVVDQLEELFTVARDRAEVRAFVACLVHAGAHEHGPLTAVFTLRADFLGKCLELDRALGERIQSGVRLVLPMTEDQLRTAIVGPAARVGLGVEAAVVDALLRELRVDAGQQAVGSVGAGAGNLPLLSFALDSLWERRRGASIGWAAWEDMGGLRGAITRRADEVFAGCTSPAQERLVRDIFGRLVELGQGTEDSRRYATRAEIEAIAPGQAGAELERWIDARLLVADEDEVWVAHEALFRAWDKLREWLAEEREALLVRQDLGRAARRWEQNGRPEDELWRGGRLRRAQELRGDGVLRLTETEAGFLDAAEAAQRAAEAAAEAQRQRELTLAREARESARRAHTASLMAGARELLARGRPEWAAQVLLAVDDPGATRGWISTARSVLTAPPLLAVFEGHKASIRAIAFSPDGTRVVSGSDDSTACIWRVDGRGDPVVLADHERRVRAVSFSPDGTRVITASWDGTARIWPADGAGATTVLEGHGDWVFEASFSPDGTRALTAGNDGTARIWRVDGAGPPIVLAGHSEHVTTARFSPDGTRVVTASKDRTARVWRADGAAAPVVLEGHIGSIIGASFSPDGARVVTASLDGTARVWHADGSGAPILVAEHKPGVATASFSPDGARVVTGGVDGIVQVCRADGAGTPVRLEGHEGVVYAARFSADGTQVLTAGHDHTARLWRADGSGAALMLAGHEGEVYAAVFSPDGTRVLTSSLDCTARLWRAYGDGAPVVITDHRAAVVAASFSPDGAHIVTASHDGTARARPTDGAGLPTVLALHGVAVTAVSFSPDGEHVVTASRDGTARVCRTDGTAQPVVLRGHEDVVRSARFSPDGARVVTASDDHSARIWAVTGADAALVLAGHEAAVTSARFSPDGARVLTASADRTARIWPAGGAGAPIVLIGHAAEVTSAQFSPDRARVLTASLD
uniref:nSTAND1 domain-containing NTPase n=1 Tax=Haliangium sp. TaxID=2663208 RepID=UPI003D0EBA11